MRDRYLEMGGFASPFPGGGFGGLWGTFGVTCPSVLSFFFLLLCVQSTFLLECSPFSLQPAIPCHLACLFLPLNLPFPST